MKNPLSVAIVGAGIAGLSCANVLQQAGVSTVVFDKSRGPGGRMCTRRGERWQCDHGAQYFTAIDPAFRTEVARWQAAGVAAPWAVQPAVIGEQEAPHPDLALQRFVGVPRMTAPARLLAEGLEMKLQTTVTQLIHEDGRWQLETQEHGRMEKSFDALILAVPAPQAVPLLKPVAGELAGLASQANMRASWAMMLRYASPLALPFEAAFINHGPLRWVARDSSKPGRPGGETWLIHATAAWSETHIEATPETVATHLLAAFTELGAPLPDSWTAHRWRYADADPAFIHAPLWHEELQLGVCGDWLNGGKVEGAWLSGLALGQRVAEGE